MLTADYPSDWTNEKCQKASKLWYPTQYSPPKIQYTLAPGATNSRYFGNLGKSCAYVNGVSMANSFASTALIQRTKFDFTDVEDGAFASLMPKRVYCIVLLSIDISNDALWHRECTVGIAMVSELVPFSSLIGSLWHTNTLCEFN